MQHQISSARENLSALQTKARLGQVLVCFQIWISDQLLDMYAQGSENPGVLLGSPRKTQGRFFRGRVGFFGVCGIFVGFWVFADFCGFLWIMGLVETKFLKLHIKRKLIQYLPSV